MVSVDFRTGSTLFLFTRALGSGRFDLLGVSVGNSSCKFALRWYYIYVVEEYYLRIYTWRNHEIILFWCFLIFVAFRANVSSRGSEMKEYNANDIRSELQVSKWFASNYSLFSLLSIFLLRSNICFVEIKSCLHILHAQWLWISQLQGSEFLSWLFEQ